MKLLLPESESESPKMNTPGGAAVVEAMNSERNRNNNPKFIIILMLRTQLSKFLLGLLSLVL